MRPDIFADLAAFRLVASESSFTRAARRLGVTQSALSQQIRRLEEKLGVRLLARTTRSVAPTEAGTRLLGKLAPALDDIETEIELLASLRDQPIGPIRISAGKHAAATILWPKLVPLMHGNPGIHIEICVDDSYVDIVAGRFDAGVRMGERLEKDMVAVPIGPPLRIAVVASPNYIRRHGAPREPAELSDHRCICSAHRWASIRHGPSTRAIITSPWRPAGGPSSMTAICWCPPRKKDLGSFISLRTLSANQ